MGRIRFALRSLLRTPVVALVVVLSLGLGIGANTAIFSLFNQIILRTLPVENPEGLVVVQAPAEFKGYGRSSTDNSGGQESIFSYLVFRGLEKSSEDVIRLAGFRNVSANIAFGNETVDGSAMLVSGEYFPVLGVRPLIGRAITPEDDIDGGGNAVAVLSYGYWQDRLGGRSDVLNQPVRVNGHVFTIVGVTPRNFTGTTMGTESDLYLPISFKPLMTPGWNGTDHYSDYWIYLFARPAPGVSIPQAEAALNSVYAGLVEVQVKEDDPFPNDEQTERFLQSRLSLVDGKYGHGGLREESRTPLFILLAATALVLLIAMANAANLMLTRSMERRKEMGIRTALGASRWEIMIQMLTEALMLSFVGGLAGLLFASWTVRLLIGYLSGGEGNIYFLTAELNWTVLGFAFGLTVLTGLLFGLHPAWDAARQPVAGTLNEDSGKASSSRGSARVRKALVGMQVAISALLLIPTGLFLKSLVNLTQVDLGIETENAITFRISPRLNAYTPEQTLALYGRIEEELATIPGVSSVAASMVPVIGGSSWGTSLAVEGYPTGPNADNHSRFNVVGPGFFSTLGIPLIAGREFTERDTTAGPKVGVVNQQFAEHFFGKENPIGRKFAPGGSDTVPDIEIVGVATDSHYSSVKDSPPRLFFTPWMQDENPSAMSFYLRTALPPESLFSQVRQVMASIDRDLPLADLRTLDQQVRRSVREDRLVLQLAAIFAFLATAMAMLGLYGVMAHSVARRTREIGIRLALGADAGNIRQLVARELLIILVAGLVVGVPAALAVARLTESQLFGVESNDPVVIATAIAALVIAALLAGYIPARRATRVNPTDALRCE